MEINIKTIDDEFHIEVSGKFNLSDKQNFMDCFDSCAEHIKNVVIDLQAVESVDSMALGMLASVHTHFAQKNGELRIVAGNNEMVKKLLSITKLDSIFLVS